MNVLASPWERALQKESKEAKMFICSHVQFFSIWVFFHEHSQFTGQDGKEEAISSTHLYHFYPVHRHFRGDNWEKLTIMDNKQSHSNRELLVFERKSLTKKLCP